MPISLCLAVWLDNKKEGSGGRSRLYRQSCETHSEQNSSPTTMHDALFPLVLVFGPGMLILLSTVSIFQFTTLFKGTAP